MDGLKQIIAKNITALRKEARLTQAEIAEKINYTDKAVSKWERGESIPDVEILKKITDLFDVPFDYLLQDEHKDEKPKTKHGLSRHNRIAITYLAAAGVWLVAAILFFFMNLKGLADTWKLFVAAIPATFVVFLVFNTIWGKKRYFFIILSVLVWTLLGFAYIMALKYNLVFIFCIGIPAQIMIVIWSRMVAK